MEKIEFPLGGNLRPGDILRTVYLDKDQCSVRDVKSAEGRNIFEMALDDYEPGCIQEVWNIEGSGAFVHRDWKDNVSLPNLLVMVDEDTQDRTFLLVSQDAQKVEPIDDGRQYKIFEKMLKSSHYIPMSLSDHEQWGEEYRVWNRHHRIEMRK